MKSNKELKDAYKQMKFRKGVFQVRNTVNNKILVGSSTDLDRAWNSHKTQLKYGNHPCTALQNDWNQLGEEHFRYEIIEELKTGEDAASTKKKN